MRNVLVLMLILLATALSAQDKLFPVTIYASGETVSIATNEWRTVTRKPYGCDIESGYGPTVKLYKVTNTYNDIISGSCGNAVPLNVYLNGNLTEIAFNPTWIDYIAKKPNGVGTVILKQSKKLYDTNLMYSSLIQFFDDCAAGSGGGPGSFTISGGSGITVSAGPAYIITNTGDLSNTNELQTLSSGTNTITLSNGGGTVTVDTDPNDEMKFGTIAGGELTGTYPNPSIAVNVIDSSNITLGGVSLTDINQSGATTSQVITWNGTAWVPDSIPESVVFDTLYADPSLQQLILSGPTTTLAEDLIDIAPVQNVTATAPIQIVTFPGGVYNAQLTGSAGATVNQALVWNGTAWVPGDVAGKIDTFRVSGGNVELSLENDDEPAHLIPVTDIAPLQGLTAGSGIALSGINNVTITNTGDVDPSDDITGLGASNRVAYFTAPKIISYTDNFRFDGTRVGIGGGNTYALEVNQIPGDLFAAKIGSGYRGLQIAHTLGTLSSGALNYYGIDGNSGGTFNSGATGNITGINYQVNTTVPSTNAGNVYATGVSSSMNQYDDVYYSTVINASNYVRGASSRYNQHFINTARMDNLSTAVVDRQFTGYSVGINKNTGSTHGIDNVAGMIFSIGTYNNAILWKNADGLLLYTNGASNQMRGAYFYTGPSNVANNVSTATKIYGIQNSLVSAGDEAVGEMWGNTVDISSSYSQNVVRGYNLTGTAFQGTSNHYGMYIDVNAKNYFKQDVTIGTNAGGAQLRVNGSATTSGTWTAQFHNSANNNALMIRNDGLIGIGTSSPAQTLHVAGTMRLTGSAGTPTSIMGRDANGDIGVAGAAAIAAAGGVIGGGTNKIALWNSGVLTENAYLNYDPSGTIGIGTPALSNNLLTLGGASVSGIVGTIAPVATTGPFTGQSFSVNTSGMTSVSGWTLFDLQRTGTNTNTGNSYYLRIRDAGTDIFTLSAKNELTFRPTGLSGFGSIQFNGTSTTSQFGFFRATNAQTGISFRNALTTDNGTGVGFKFSVTTTAAYTAVTNTAAKILTIDNGQLGGTGYDSDLFYVQADGKSFSKRGLSVGSTNTAAILTATGASSVSGDYTFLAEKGDGTDILTVENNGDTYFNTLSGTGDRLMYLTSAGKTQRSTIDPATLPTVSGTTDQVAVFSGTTTLGSSNKLVSSTANLFARSTSAIELSKAGTGTTGLRLDFYNGNARLNGNDGTEATFGTARDMMLQTGSGALHIGTTVDTTSKVTIKGLATATPILTMEDNTGAAKYVFENDGSFIAATLAGTGTQLAQILSTGELSRSSVDVSALITTSTTAGGDLSGPISNLQIEPGVVTSTEILNGTIALADMGSSSVNSAIIIDGSVGALDLNPQSATTGQIMRYAGIGVGWTPGDVGGVVSGPVTNLVLADNTVTSGKIVNGSIQPVDLFFSSYSLGSTMYSDGSSWLWGQNRWEGYNDANLGGGTGTVALSSNRIDNLVRGSAWTSLTLQLPALPSDGQLTAVTFDVAATSITWDGSGKTIIGTLPSTIVVGDSFYFKYYAATDKWYRIKF